MTCIAKHVYINGLAEGSFHTIPTVHSSAVLCCCGMKGPAIFQNLDFCMFSNQNHAFGCCGMLLDDIKEPRDVWTAQERRLRNDTDNCIMSMTSKEGLERGKRCASVLTCLETQASETLKGANAQPSWAIRGQRVTWSQEVSQEAGC